MSAVQLLFEGGIQIFVPRVRVRFPSRDWEWNRGFVFMREHFTISCTNDREQQQNDNAHGINAQGFKLLVGCTNQQKIWIGLFDVMWVVVSVHAPGGGSGRFF